MPLSKVDSGIRGVVVSGPRCPIVTVENPCPDRPVAGIVVQLTAPVGSTRETRTNTAGRFEVAVAPGEYVVQPVVDRGGVGFAKPLQVTVPEGRFVEVTLQVDTGIR